MKIFLSYGHDSNTPLIDKIREYLSSNINGENAHEVWIDKSEIKSGQDWRLRITEGIKQSDVVLAGLSVYSTRDPGVCRNEINISIGVMGGNIKTILLEPADVVSAPAMLSHIQWLDMSDWKEHAHEGFENNYFKAKFKELSEMIITPENEKFNGDINLLKKKLCPISSLSRIQSLTQKHMYGRQWLYNKIEDWDKSNSSRIFWIIGGPGFGKSTFAANLQQTYNVNIPAVQFVEWGKPIHSNPCAIIRNLAFQLAIRYPDYLCQLLSLPQLDELLDLNENELFDVLFCEGMFLRIDGGHENVWVLIDALDEANDEFDNKIAQTIARHIERLPKWIKFIITSRDDSKVRLPLQHFKPQIYDLDNSIRKYNRQDMIDYLLSELEEFNPTINQCAKIADKSEGVFLYLQFVVDDIKTGIHTISEINELPKDLDSYYYSLFYRSFNNNMSFYIEFVSKVLEILVSSPKTMNISLIKECSGIETDKQFYQVLDSIQNLIRIENNEIKFFHSSLQNWLTNYNVSGCFFVSKQDGIKKICMSFVKWLSCDDTTLDNFWLDYNHGFIDCERNNIAMPSHFSGSHINTLFKMFCPEGGCGFGAIVKYCFENMGFMENYLDNILYKKTDSSYLLSLLNGLFESVKDRYIELGIVSPISRTFEYPDSDKFNKNGQLIYQTIKQSAFYCAVIEYIGARIKNLEVVKRLISNVEILAFYNSRLGEILIGEINSLSDMADFTAIEMERRISNIQ